MSSQLDLFTAPPCEGPQQQQGPGLVLRFWRDWARSEADSWLLRLRQEVSWKQEKISLFGRTHPIPRLTCWVGNPGCSYTYSGVSNQIEPWTPLLQELREQVQTAAGCEFNSLLLNRYRDGRDKLDWHADDEPELEPEAPIASLSLGAARSFRLKPKDPVIHPGSPLVYELGHGDLLVMDPPTQKYWLHQVPPRLRVKAERINLTFRVIRPEAMRNV